MIKEEQLELIYYFALKLKCPLSSAKTRSLARLAIKALKVYNQVLLLHEKTLSEVNQLLTAEIKLLGAIADV